MKLAFSLESWEGCGGDEELSGEEALREGNMHIDTALTIFKEVQANWTAISTLRPGQNNRHFAYNIIFLKENVFNLIQILLIFALMSSVVQLSIKSTCFLAATKQL